MEKNLKTEDKECNMQIMMIVVYTIHTVSTHPVSL